MQTRAGSLAVMAVLLMVTSGLAPSLGALGPRGPVPNTDSEPNNTMADATVVSVSGTIKGTLLGADHWDNYKFQAAMGGGVATKTYIEVDLDQSNPLVSVYLRDTNGFLLDFARDVQVAKLYNVATGPLAWYYLNITDDTLKGETYNVTVSFTTEPFTGDSNNNPSEAVLVGSFPFTANKTLNGGTDPMDVQDFYKVSLSRTVSKADLLVTQLKQAPTAMYWVEVYDSSLKNVDAYEREGDPKPGSTQTYSYGTQAAGIYYVRVWASNGTGSYSLSMNRFIIDINDNNNDPANATPLNIINNHTASFSGNVAEGLDLVDYWSLPVVQGQMSNATIASLDYNASTGLPTMHLELMRSDGTTMYDVDPNMTHDQLNPTGFTNGTAADNGPVLNYIMVFVDNKASGGGNYIVNLLTDRPPVANASLIGPITINESTTDKPTSDSSIKLKNLFKDPDGNDRVTYSYRVISDQGMGDPKNLTVNIAKDPDMTVTLAPRRATAIQSGYRGEGDLALTATDNYGLNATAVFHIKVTGTNHAPYVKVPYNATYAFKDPVTLLYGVTTLIDVDLTKVFGDQDLNDKLTYDLNGSSPNIEVKDYGHTSIDNRYFLKSATINDTFILSFNLKGNLVEQTGIVSVRLNTDSPKVKKAKDDRTPLEEPVWFNVLDNGVPPKWGNHTVKLVLKGLSPNGTPPKWVQTFTKISFPEDGNVTIDLDTLTTDIDIEDAHARTYAVSGTGPNVTVKQTDRSHFTFWAKTHWSGTVKGVLLNCTDSFKLYKTHTIDIEVTYVAYPPIKDATKPPEGATVNMTEGESMPFHIATHVLDAITTQVYNWTLDGIWLRTEVGPNFTFQPSFDEAGTHHLTVVVSNMQHPKLNVSANWAINVTNVNRAPTNVIILSPTDGQIFKEGVIISLLAARATDLDKEDAPSLTYKWKVDGQFAGSSQTYDIKAPKKGAHTIVLEVSDGTVTISKTVNITIQAKTVSQTVDPAMVAGALVVLIFIAVILGLALRGRKVKPTGEDKEDIYAADRAAKKKAAKAKKKAATDEGSEEEDEVIEEEKGPKEEEDEA
jgi:hypothetical protein